MKGNIISKEKCFLCGGSLKHDNRRHGLFCPDHPQVAAVKSFIVRFGRDVQKQFRSYDRAAQFLNGVRFKTSEGSFDARDYQSDKPFAFCNLADKYLKLKSHLKSIKEARRHIQVAVEYFGDRNVKDITGADIEEYLYSINGISEKTRANYCSRVSDFWKWILRRGIINMAQMPLFPRIEFELEYRTITDMDTQEAIINGVREQSERINPKIWFGIDLLSTYVNIRPGDLLKIRERDIDIQNGIISIHHPTKKKNKKVVVRLLDHHIEMFRDLKAQFPGLPEVKFFRHNGGLQRTIQGQPFGPKLFKVYWDRACASLGVHGLDLYGGTRHTTTTEIARRAGTANARKASAHQTNSAFDRYCQYQDDTAFDMAKIVKGKGGQLVKFGKK